MIVDSSLSQKEKSSWLGHYLLGRPPRLKRLLKIEDRKSRNTVKLTEKNYPFYLHSFLKGTWQVYTLFYKAQWGKNSQFIQKFTFWKYHFLKIHNFKISFFTKFTISKYHFSQNSHFPKINFRIKSWVLPQCARRATPRGGHFG